MSTPEVPSIVMAAHVARIGGSPKRSYTSSELSQRPLGKILLSCARETSGVDHERENAERASVLLALDTPFYASQGFA